MQYHGIIRAQSIPRTSSSYAHEHDTPPNPSSDAHPSILTYHVSIKYETEEYFLPSPRRFHRENGVGTDSAADVGLFMLTIES
jgi:hypothetical protein